MKERRTTLPLGEAGEILADPKAGRPKVKPIISCSAPVAGVDQHARLGKAFRHAGELPHGPGIKRQ